MSNLPALAPIRVFTLPPIWGAPSPSPFVIKLLTFLRMAGLPYEIPGLNGPPRSPTGKIPYIELPDGQQLHDSGLIVDALTARYQIALDDGLSPEQRAQSHAVRRMVEEHTYFVGAHERWLTPAGYAATSRAYFAHLPAPLRLILPFILRRRIRANMFGQGIGRHPAEVVAAAGRADIEALAILLGDREFFHGRPTSVDATLYGFLAAWMSNPYESSIQAGAVKHPNLVAYYQRMKSAYWAD